MPGLHRRDGPCPGRRACRPSPRPPRTAWRASTFATSSPRATTRARSSHRTCDALAWEYISALLPPAAHVVDAGIGAGHWLRRLLAMGHRVTGIEQAPGMIAILEVLTLPPGFTPLRHAMEDAPVGPASADLVMTLGLVQTRPIRGR